MTTIDLTPLYSNTIGFERLASMLDSAFRGEQANSNYPPYDIEALDEHRYALALAVAGFKPDELDIQAEPGLLTVRGRKADDKSKRKFLYQGIATRAFERKFNIADHVEITGARLDNGMLTIELKHELPEAMKPKRIEINTDSNVIEHQPDTEQAA
ncbi:MAG: Hsp20 family protein [Thioalkalispiraceae bacterium]|jgi:molecular chaperone IbpA